MANDDEPLSWHEQVRRKASLPIPVTPDEQRPRGQSVPVAARRRGFSLARPRSTMAKKRKVTFKNCYTPDVAPRPSVESYDELVFNVAGLFHTVSFLHEPEEWEDPTYSVSSDDSEFYDPEPPLERSVPLMIAEFLYRSAVYLGYPQGDTPWLPGFREDKGFSGNDVKRWRRLAHFDWEEEERQFLKNHQPRLARNESTESNGQTSVMSAIGSSFRVRRQESTDSTLSTASQDVGAGKKKFRTAVSGWIRKHRRQKSRENELVEQVGEVEDDKTEEKKKQSDTHKPVSWLNPPRISSSKDLKLLVDIVNSCVYCGQFQFRKRDIVRLCNVRI